LTISIALFALAEQGKLILRSGARVGDIVAVAGEFGNTAAGLKALIEKRKRPGQLDRTFYRAVFYPHAQLDLGMRLAASRAITSSIDSSDGLALSLHQLAKESRVGIDLNRIPVSKAAKRFAQLYDYDADSLALYGGEEYHLVVTIRSSKIRAAQRAAKGLLQLIGVVTGSFRGVRFEHSGKDTIIARKGWEHFKG
jgi:thiamine-monophosphate kinase